MPHRPCLGTCPSVARQASLQGLDTASSPLLSTDSILGKQGGICGSGICPALVRHAGSTDMNLRRVKGIVTYVTHLSHGLESHVSFREWEGSLEDLVLIQML